MQKTNLREINVHIDYYCFPTQTGDISVFTNLEQYNANNKKREYYERTLNEVNKAREKGKLILFDLQTNCFIDENGESVDIAGKVVFPRSPISHSELLIESIEKAGGKSITQKQDYEITKRWFEKVKTKRKYKLTTMGELESNLDFYKSRFGEIFFVKTVDKGYSGMGIIFELSPDRKFLTDSHYHNLNLRIRNPETPIIIYKWLDGLYDEFGIRQWRAFVVNDELLSLSRFSNETVPIEEYIYKEVRKKIKQFKGIMPSAYVVDFLEYREVNNTAFEVVQFNPIIVSETFANNDLVF